MTPEDRYAAIRQSLQAERARVLDHSAAIDSDDAEWASTAASAETRRELLAEGDMVSVERQMLAQLSATARKNLDDIDTALRRIDEGTYGTCAGCGNEIPVERLEIRPHATHCVRCASRR
jgi:DnaK suppressor protein